MAVSGTFSGNTSSAELGPGRVKITIACIIPNGGVDFEWRRSGESTWYTGYSFDSNTEFPRTLAVNTSDLQYRLTRTSHSSAVYYYMGS